MRKTAKFFILCIALSAILCSCSKEPENSSKSDTTSATTFATTSVTTTVSKSETTKEITSTTPPVLSDSALISTAQKCFKDACQKSWEYSGGNKFLCDYEQKINENDKDFFVVTNTGFTSLADVNNDWFSVFSSSIPLETDGVFIEKDGKLWTVPGERGVNIFYQKTEITEIKSKNDNGEIVFDAVSYYEDTDNISDEIDKYQETKEFAIILENGSYKTSKFTLPY